MKAWIWPSVDVDVAPAVPVLAEASADGGGGGGGTSLVERAVSPFVPADAVIDCRTVSSALIRVEAESVPLVEAADAVPAAPAASGGGASMADGPSGPVPPSEDPDRRARKAIMAEEVALPVLSIDVPEAVLAAPIVPEAAVVL